MKVLRIESVGGASGDMLLGAFMQLGIDMDDLARAMDSFPMPFKLVAEPHSSHGLNGVQVRVETPHEHAHRTLPDIEKMIADAGLPEKARDLSLKVFRRLAEAEAAVHKTTPDKIHFHEVGAADSIIDIVGNCLALTWLEVDAVSVAPLPLGCGTVECAHGTYPVPAPATVELLKDFPVVQTEEPHELVTPTGAALLTTWHNTALPPAGCTISLAGYSFGQRQLDGRPNVLRASLLASTAQADEDPCLLLECHVDDTTPELMGHLVERLLAAGALDAFIVPVQMKKQRPGMLLTVLCRPASKATLVDLIFRESTTFGIREQLVNRTVLARRVETVETPYGPVGVKMGTWRGDVVTRAPEMADCIVRAEEAGVAVRVVYEAAARAAGPASGGRPARRDSK